MIVPLHYRGIVLRAYTKSSSDSKAKATTLLKIKKQNEDKDVTQEEVVKVFQFVYDHSEQVLAQYQEKT